MKKATINQSSDILQRCLFKLMHSWIACIVICTTLVSCGGDDEPMLDEVVGTWRGTSQYNNPVGGTKRQYLTLSLESNHTGTLEFEGATLYSMASFKYSVSGNIIKLKGAYANTSGSIEDDFAMTLRVEGDRIIPLEKYTQFILTRDNSVLTDADGNEIIDNSDDLKGVWKNTTGETILDISDSTYKEYVLTKAFSDEYDYVIDGTYSYNFTDKIITLGINAFDVIDLTSSHLELKRKSNSQKFSFTRGTNADIPHKPQLETMLKGKVWYSTAGTVQFWFKETGEIQYYQKSSKKIGSWGEVFLIAEGTYQISGNNVTCYYTDISDGASGNIGVSEKYWPGWSSASPCTKTYIFEVNGDNIVATFPNGTKYTLKTNHY